MRYGLLILVALLAGCESKPEDPTSKNQENQPADVAAIRGSGSEVKTPLPYTSGFAAHIEGEISALNHAKEVGAAANAKIKQDDKLNDSAGQ
jgi:hypothetical protein